MREALAHTDLVGFESRSVLSLSGGELQRVFLAQALVQESNVLLLDEPTAHLDVHYQFEFMDLVRDLIAGGRTVIAVFHDLEMAARYADDVLILRDGLLAATGPPIEVLSEELIARVFRMDARIGGDGGKSIRIQYVGPISKQAV
jgi:iron complex transport system ATP-binding protein